jgi:uncharacterized membrane protein
MLYTIASWAHITTATIALTAGACVLLASKGTRLHRWIGYTYFFSMLTLNISALFIYQLTGYFGPFHGAALASLITLIAGFIPVYFRIPHGGWLELHFEFMSWSYVGLVAAGASEIATRVPSSPFWPAVFVSTMAIFSIGGYLIVKRRSKFVTGVWKVNN